MFTEGEQLSTLMIKYGKYVYLTTGLLLLALSYQMYSWMGVLFLFSGAVTWGLLHYYRMLQVFQRAANRPVGYVGSAVMLYSKLHAGMSLLHVIAMTRSLGVISDAITPEMGKNALENYTWHDQSGSYIRCTFDNGRLLNFELIRA